MSTEHAPTPCVCVCAHSLSPPKHWPCACVFTTQMQQLLVCYVCHEVAAPPWCMCENGHVVCESHLAQLVRCGACRESLQRPYRVPLRFLMGVAEALGAPPDALLLPCGHDGCERTLAPDLLAAHRSVCEHRARKCPVTKCTVPVTRAALTAHVCGPAHKAVAVEEAPFEAFIDVRSNTGYWLFQDTTLVYYSTGKRKFQAVSMDAESALVTVTCRANELMLTWNSRLDHWSPNGRWMWVTTVLPPNVMEVTLGVQCIAPPPHKRHLPTLEAHHERLAKEARVANATESVIVIK